MIYRGHKKSSSVNLLHSTALQMKETLFGIKKTEMGKKTFNGETWLKYLNKKGKRHIFFASINITNMP